MKNANVLIRVSEAIASLYAAIEEVRPAAKQSRSEFYLDAMAEKMERIENLFNSLKIELVKQKTFLYGPDRTEQKTVQQTEQKTVQQTEQQTE